MNFAIFTRVLSPIYNPLVDVNRSDNNGWTALHHAALTGQLAVVKDLVSLIDPNGYPRTDINKTMVKNIKKPIIVGLNQSVREGIKHEKTYNCGIKSICT
ncbi:MAG: ankyrin repeat domain-containing protein [Desulfosporosinus sp.]|nr:ankyrin repeat domain-containing protein [Desulfosporosinus sp.]